MNDHYASVAEIGELLRAKKRSPEDLVEQCLERIERFNPDLNAFITVTPDQAREAAKNARREIGAGRGKGPLHGVPVAVKDFFDTAGIRTTAAFAAFEQRVPAKDAEVITRLKELGAILIGKTNMHELGMGTTSVASHFGSVRNPWDRAYCAGGSSGGSAAAVAAGLCFATVDTDAIGSCRLPAALCGVVGFKPSYESISTRGILEGEEGADALIRRLSHGAVQCRSVEDAALVLDALATTDAQSGGSRASTIDTLDHPRIGAVTNYRASAAVRATLRDALDVLRASGCAISEIEAPLDAPFSIDTIDRDRTAISERLFTNVDVLVLPTTADAAPRIEDARSDPRAVAAHNTYFGNYYALPAISVPCGFDPNGIPLGLQIVGPARGERTLLEVARRFERATKWHEARPPL